MLGLGMPGPFEWLIILIMLAIVVGVLWLLIRAGRPASPRPRGFEVNPHQSDRAE
jgi:hypothetical protein